MSLLYCVKCRKKTDTDNLIQTTLKNGRPALTGTCAVCGTKKVQFISGFAKSKQVAKAKKKGKNPKKPKEGAGFINDFINNLPVEMHLPGFNFCGPGTKLNKRLNPDLTPKKWSKPINRVDQACYKHDIGYAKHSDTATRNKLDEEMLKDLKHIYNPSIGERISRGIIVPFIATKKRFGMGLETNSKASKKKSCI